MFKSCFPYQPIMDINNKIEEIYQAYFAGLATRDANGNLYYDLYSLKGDMHSGTLYWHYKDGGICMETEYANGVTHGRRTTYNMYGRPVKETKFDNGVEVGPVFAYKHDGTISAKAFISDGVMIKREYYKNGKKFDEVWLGDKKAI